MSTDIAIGDENGQVFLRFQHAVEWIALDPGNALQIGEAIARSAYAARYGKRPQQQDSIISKEVRQRLVNRINVMLTSMASQRRSRAYMAAQIVDTILSEVA